MQCTSEPPEPHVIAAACPGESHLSHLIPLNPGNRLCTWLRLIEIGLQMLATQPVRQDRDEHLAVVAASLPSGGRIVFGPEWKAGHAVHERTARTPTSLPPLVPGNPTYPT